MPDLTTEERELLIKTLKARFENNRNRHPDISWTEVLSRLEAHPKKLVSLYEMERTGGEPDVIGRDMATQELLFADCSAESPAGRRGFCYDSEALESRKEHKPISSVLDMTSAIGIELLSEQQYRDLQKLGSFDTKTSSWVKTPPEIRELGGALFCDRRYNQVFTYHNGADSYYAARGFRGMLRV